MTEAVEHEPAQVSYYDSRLADDVVIRLRAMLNDVQNVRLILWDEAGTSTSLPMRSMAADEAFEFFEVHLFLNTLTPRPISYGFLLTDATLSEPWPERYDFQSTATCFPTPAWARDAVWYQIMVDRFRDGDPGNNPEKTVGSSTPRINVTHPWNSSWYHEQPWENDGKGKTFWHWAMYERLYGGDFEGVIQKLDYLKELGITAIYLNPVFEASNAHKYNGRSYVFMDDGYGVPGEFDKSIARCDLSDPQTWFFNGSDEKFLELVRQCHERGIRIIIDGVFNHLGDDAIPFLDLKEKKQASKFADWYEIKSWEPFDYSGWAGFGGLPQFRKDAEHGLASASLREHLFAVTRRWLDPNGDGDPSDGIDGWRLDVPFEIPQAFWVEWRKVVKSVNPDAYIVGEIWDDAHDWLDGRTFDAVMNYPLARIAFRYFGNVEQKSTATQFDRELGMLRVRYPRSASYNLQNLYDSHDTDRWVSRLANPDMIYDEGNRKQDSGPNYMDDRPAPANYQRLRLMALFQATYIGAPMIWYGTEVGMYGADDPMCRMPMWWEDLGPYENKDYVIMDDLRSMFTQLFALRREHSALRRGDFARLYVSDAQDAYAFARWVPGEEELLVVALNNSPQQQVLNIAADDLAGLLEGSWGKSQVIYGSPKAVEPSAEDGLTFTLDPISGVLVKIRLTEQP